MLLAAAPIHSPLLATHQFHTTHTTHSLESKLSKKKKFKVLSVRYDPRDITLKDRIGKLQRERKKKTKDDAIFVCLVTSDTTHILPSFNQKNRYTPIVDELLAREILCVVFKRRRIKKKGGGECEFLISKCEE